MGYEEDNMDDSKRAERKFKKHMVEKRRRNRINYALDQLKMMVLEGLDKDPSKYDKMEKADILDLTVKYLHRILKENIHTGPELPPGVQSMFGGPFPGFLHPHLPPPHSILPEPCPSSALLEEPLDLHQSMTSQATAPSNITSQSSVTSQSRDSPPIDIDSDSDSDTNDTVKCFKPVKKTESSNTVKRSLEVNEAPSKRHKTETDVTSTSSIKLNITGQTIPSVSLDKPQIVRPVATIPRLTLRTDTNLKAFPNYPYPGHHHPYAGMGALLPLPIMPGEPQWRPW